MFGGYLEDVRKKVPLIYNITNYVTVNDVANVILACGGSPVMSDEPEEAEEMAQICDGLNINIGTLNVRSIESMLKAGKKARSMGKPVVLDPVGAGAGKFRTETALRLIKELKPDVIKGNISEIKALAEGRGTTRGVDVSTADAFAGENIDAMVDFVKAFAKKIGVIIAVTGEKDFVSDGERCFVIGNGRPEMCRVSGLGCQISGIMAAVMAAGPEDAAEAAAAAVCIMGLAGEKGCEALREGEGSGSYRTRIMDAVYNMDGKSLDEGAIYEIR